MTDRCGIYWRLMYARDKAAQTLAVVKRNGSRTAIDQAENAVVEAQENETSHLQTCPVCSRWNEEMRKLAEKENNYADLDE